MKLLRRETDITTQLIKGDRGIFDVRADGVLIFSKKDAGRFPNAPEIVKLARGSKT